MDCGQHWVPGSTYKVALFYRYVPIDDVNELIEKFRDSCIALGLLGRILVGNEGINGTLAGSTECIDCFAEWLKSDERFALIDMKYSCDMGLDLPFLSLSIRQVDEIVSSGPMKSFISDNIQYDSSTFGGITGTGVHLKPEEFHSAIAAKKPNAIILDIRNKFEYDIGHFEGSVGLDTFYYSETWGALDTILDGKRQKQFHHNHHIYDNMDSTTECETPNVATSTDDTNTLLSSGNIESESSENAAEGAGSEDNNGVTQCEREGKQQEQQHEQPEIYMYCTGGIRCEKASAYLKAKGFDNVYQLQGGIHKYLEAYPDGGVFQGKNFVFDSRVAMAPANANANTNGVSADCSSAFGVSAVSGTATQKGAEDATERDDAVLSETITDINTRTNSESKSTSCTTANVTNSQSAAVAAATIASNIVGQCIDCHTPHDVYSGFITCTVCRMPVLVCPKCVAGNLHPGEYHCVRHRDLKDFYFTVLEKYNQDELTRQLGGLTTLLDESLEANKVHQRELKKQGRVVIDQKYNHRNSEEEKNAACATINNHENSTADVENVLAVPSTSETSTTTATAAAAAAAAATRAGDGDVTTAAEAGRVTAACVAKEVGTIAASGKNRRNTLRKQIDRVKARLGMLNEVKAVDSSTAGDIVSEVGSGASTVGGITTPTTDCGGDDVAPASVPVSTVVVENSTTSAGSVAAAEEEVNKVETAEVVIPVNPKSRGGWGFWRT